MGIPTGARDFARVIKKHGYNPGLVFQPGTVLQLEPEIKIAMGDNGRIVLDQEDIVINQDLMPMTETVKIDGVDHVIEYPFQIKVGDKLLLAYNRDSIGFLAYVIMICENFDDFDI
jgi:hypothetical protein